MRDKRKLKVHWVNGVEKRSRVGENKTNHTRWRGRKEEEKHDPEMGRVDKNKTTPEIGVDEDKRN